MKRPAYQHYPGDWRRNAKLRRCSWAARGAWVEILGLMHDSDEYGLLRWTLKEIANGVGCPLALVKELADKKVMKGDDNELADAYVYAPYHAGKRGPEVVLVPKQIGPIWFSSRMIRDEHNRTKRGIGSRFGGAPNPPIGGGSVDGASIASSTSIETSVEPRDSAREDDRKTKGGHKNGHESQKLGSIAAWMTDEQAALRKGETLGIKPHSGESWTAFRGRIMQAESIRKTA